MTTAYLVGTIIGVLIGFPAGVFVTFIKPTKVRPLEWTCPACGKKY